MGRHKSYNVRTPHLRPQDETYSKLIEICKPRDHEGHSLLRHCANLSRGMLRLFGRATADDHELSEVAALTALFWSSSQQRQMALSILADDGPATNALDKCCVCFTPLYLRGICFRHALCAACRQSLEAILKRWLASNQAHLEKLQLVLR